MKFTNLTRNTEIGANCYLLEINGKNIVIDAGLHPREEGTAALPNLQAIHGLNIDAIFASHSHLDHIGSLPVLQSQHPEARVFMSQATVLLAEAMLHNCVNVMVKKREELGIPDYPFFTHRQVKNLSDQWHSCPLNIRMTLDGRRCGGEKRPDEVVFTLFDAGHILGSVGILIEYAGKKVFYTGDVQFEAQTISQPANFPLDGIDLLIAETTRGNKARSDGYTRKGEANRLAQAVSSVFQRGGCVLMPMFALGRTQEMLFLFHELMGNGKMPQSPIYIGGLSGKLSMLYDRLRRQSIFRQVAPQVLTGRDVGRFTPRRGSIYAMSSGMMTENTLSNIFASNILPDPMHAVFFIGYTDPNSPAGHVRATTKGEAVLLNQQAGSIKRNCEIQEFDFSAHAPRHAILEYILATQPRKAILIHGELPSIQWFTESLKASDENIEVIIPESNQPIVL